MHEGDTMTLWEFFNTTAGAASIFGVIVTLGAWWTSRSISRSTNQLIREVHSDTQRTLDAMDARAHDRHQEVMREIKPDQPA
jgi:hypothetical protein